MGTWQVYIEKGEEDKILTVVSDKLSKVLVRVEEVYPEWEITSISRITKETFVVA